MKRAIIFFVILTLCISMFSTTVFAFENETSTDMAFTAGSAGMFCLDENNAEHFISADEILAYNVPNTPIVLVKAVFHYTDKPSETRRGTGAFIGPSGILTCAHVLYDKENAVWASEVSVMTKYNFGSYDNIYYRKEIMIGAEYKNSNLDDWGIITINETSKVGYYGFRAAENADEVDRLPVTLVGFTPYEGDLELMKSDGVLKASRTLGRVLPHVYSTCKVSEGMSGGPYLENTAYVRGIVTMTHNIESQGLLINTWLKNALYEHSGR